MSRECSCAALVNGRWVRPACQWEQATTTSLCSTADPRDWAAATGRPLETGGSVALIDNRDWGCANLSQFCLLVAVNALVGGMVGQEQTVLPLFANKSST